MAKNQTRAPKAKPEPAPMIGANPQEKFQIKVIHRSEIITAEYNPRLITDENKATLRNSLKIHGLVEPLIWNVRTRTLVSGHQRLSIMDEEQGSLDYMLTVSVVDLDEVQEVELNIMLNNPNAQGVFDFDKIAQIEELDLKNAGFNKQDSDFFNGLRHEMTLSNKTVEEIVDQFDEIKQQNRPQKGTDEYLEKKARVDAVKKDVQSTVKEPSAYLTIVFESSAYKNLLLERFGLQPGEQYIMGADLLKELGLSLSGDTQSTDEEPTDETEV